MKITKIILMIFLLFSCVALAQNLTTQVTMPQDTGLEILSNWHVIAIMAIIISVILVAIGYAVGIGFEMPEMQAWARSELSQVFANVLIIIFLMGTVAFIDMATMAMVAGSGVGGLTCVPSENCLGKVANAYLEDYINASRDGAKNVLKNNMEASAWANRRVGLYCYVIYCAQLGVTTTVAGQYILDSDRYSIVFEYYQGLLASLKSQQFFINEISFKIGPLILGLGIVARAFFFSRRLGGLLIAIAAGIMFFFPAMYIFNWMSLDMMLTGDDSVMDQASLCPIECGYSAPLAFANIGGNSVGLNTTSDIYDLFDDSKSDEVRNLILGETKSLISKDGYTVETCNINISKPGFGSYKVSNDQQEICDRSCRELPYPSGSNLCANYSMQLACSGIPEACKVKRIVAERDPVEEAKCPTECKMVPPMKSDCNVKSDGTTAGGNCLKSRFDCRVAKYSDMSWRPSIDKDLKGSDKCNKYPKDCVADTNAENSCTWVIPEFGSCEDLCTGCPEECRFEDPTSVDFSSVPQCFDSDKKYIGACTACPTTCKIDIARINNIAPTDLTNCTNCQANHRIISAFEVLPANYTTDTSTHSCSFESCPVDYRMQVPRSACEQCIEADEEYTYNPPVNFNCGDLCKPPDVVPSKSSGDYTSIGQDGLVGREEIKAVSKLMIPGYLLPLFNIAATIIVIRALAGILGGDVEIPGLSKIF